MNAQSSFDVSTATFLSFSYVIILNLQLNMNLLFYKI